MTDDMPDNRLMKKFDSQLSSVEKDVKAIKDAVNNNSLEEKLGRAIEIIENKLDKLTAIIYSQRESDYNLQYINTEVRILITSSTLLSALAVAR